MNVDYKGKNCIVTGGSGFIGQNIVNALIQHEAHVYVIDNFSYGAKKSSVHRDAYVYPGNVATYESFARLPNIEYKYLFHFASPSSIILFNQNPNTCVQETVSGFMNALEYCSKRSIRLVFPSSGSLYAGTALPQKETSIVNLSAINAYAKTKHTLEQIQYARGEECDTLALRIFAGYGPSETHKNDIASVVYSFCKTMHAGESPVIFGNGTQERDFIYISDLANAIITLAEHCNEKVINIGSGKSISFTDLVTTINSVIGAIIKPIYVESPNGYLERTLADTSLLKQYFNQTITPTEEGIANILRSL